MISLDTLLNAYIDANVILLIAAVVWGLTRFALSRTSLRTSFGAQLRLLYGVLIVMALAPFVVAALLTTGSTLAVNLSDIMVAQYLDGRFAMAPSKFEQLLTMRDTFVNNIITLGSPAGIVIAIMLVVGIGASLVRTTVSVTKVRRVIAKSYSWRQFGKLQIRLTDASHVPFSTRGFRQRYIVLPSSMLSQPVDMRIALAHEFQHVRQGDLNWELVLEALRPFFFFNPAMVFWKHEVENLRELACDQQVLQRTGLTARDYCACLVRVCLNALRKDNSAQIAIPSVAFVQLSAKNTGSRSEKFLRMRVTEMMRGHRSHGPDWLISAFLIPLSIAIGLSAVSIQRSADWSQDRLMLSAIVNLERLNQRNGLN